MMQVEYRLKLGQDEFVIRGDYKNEKEFFQKMAFFSSLPKTAPGGSTDLKLVVRETKKGTYYSLISEKEQMEFQLGQHKEGDTLYAKGWVKAYSADGEEGQASQGAAPIQTPIQQAAAPVVAPVTQQFVAPAPVQAAPAPIQQAAPIAAPVQAVAPAPVQQAAPAAPAPAANPQVTAVANNVLARFGINK